MWNVKVKENESPIKSLALCPYISLEFCDSSSKNQVSFFYKITQHHDVLNCNDAGKMVVFGKAQPGTDFDNLFKSMVGRTRDQNQPGIEKFLTEVKANGVCSKELSGKALHKIFTTCSV